MAPVDCEQSRAKKKHYQRVIAFVRSLNMHSLWPPFSNNIINVIRLTKQNSSPLSFSFSPDFRLSCRPSVRYLSSLISSLPSSLDLLSITAPLLLGQPIFQLASITGHGNRKQIMRLSFLYQIKQFAFS